MLVREHGLDGHLHTAPPSAATEVGKIQPKHTGVERAVSQPAYYRVRAGKRSTAAKKSTPISQLFELASSHVVPKISVSFFYPLHFFYPP